MRILVVNNNFTDRKHAARMLESTLPNYLIEKVGSLNAAKNRLVKHHYDAVFLQNNQSDNQHEQEIRTLQAIPDAKHTAIIIIADHITDSLNEPIFPTGKPALISKQELGKSSIKQTIIKAKNELKVSDNESRRIQDLYENDPLTGLFNRHHFIESISKTNAIRYPSLQRAFRLVKCSLRR